MLSMAATYRYVKLPIVVGDMTGQNGMAKAQAMGMAKTSDDKLSTNTPGVHLNSEASTLNSSLFAKPSIYDDCIHSLPRRIRCLSSDDTSSSRQVWCRILATGTS